MSDARTNPPEVPMEAIVAALAKLNYQPENNRLDAAQRLSWVPELALDMIAFANKGAPKFDPQTGQPPKEIVAPLPDGHTVKSLMDDYLLDNTGAFLMAAALITHHDEAVGMLEKIIKEGLYIKEADGSIVHQSVPAEAKYPECEVCGELLIHPGKFCPLCGSPVKQSGATEGAPPQES